MVFFDKIKSILSNNEYDDYEYDEFEDEEEETYVDDLPF